MIEGNRLAALLVDQSFDRIPDTQLAVLQHAEMGYGCAQFLRVAHDKAAVCSQKHAGVANLATAFSIERSVVQHDLGLLARTQHIDNGSVENQRRDPGDVREPLIAGKHSLPVQLYRLAQLRAKLSGRSRG